LIKLALIGSISASEGFLQWIDGDFDEEYSEGNDVKLLSNKPKQMMMQTKSKSDPIHGSLGPPEWPTDYIPTAEEKLERDLQSRKPLEQVDDREQVGDSQDSIAWAEANLGEKLKLPEKEAQERVRVDQRLEANQDHIDD